MRRNILFLIIFSFFWLLCPAQGTECKVNLIRFHAIPDVELQTSDLAQMERFRDLLNEHGLTATIRASRGEDIYAACGMLSSTKRGNTQSYTE